MRVGMHEACLLFQAPSQTRACSRLLVSNVCTPKAWSWFKLNSAPRQVHLFGGCVTSWKQASGDEVLYIRPDAKFDGSKPISGGIPHCFPQVAVAAQETYDGTCWPALLPGFRLSNPRNSAMRACP